MSETINSTYKKFFKIISIIAICHFLVFFALLYLPDLIHEITNRNSYDTFAKSTKAPTEYYYSSPQKGLKIDKAPYEKTKHKNVVINHKVASGKVKTALLLINNKVDELFLIAKIVDKELKNKRYCSAYNMTEEESLKIQDLDFTLEENWQILKKDQYNRYVELLSQLSDAAYEKRQKLHKACELQLELTNKMVNIIKSK
jgi:hypothetical protein